MEDTFESPISKVNDVQDILNDDHPKPIDPEVVCIESKEQCKEPDTMESGSGTKGEQSTLQVPLTESLPPVQVPMPTSTPNEATVPVLNVNEPNLNPGATSYVPRMLSPGQEYQLGGVSSLVNTSETSHVVTRLAASIDSIVTRSNLPP